MELTASQEAWVEKKVSDYNDYICEKFPEMEDEERQELLDEYEETVMQEIEQDMEKEARVEEKAEKLRKHIEEYFPDMEEEKKEELVDRYEESVKESLEEEDD